MTEQRDFYQLVEDICAKDNRYKPDSYEFVMQALHFTQGKLKREGHITGRELLEGIREFVIEQYGPMAKTVLNHWGITKTEDFGNIVFNLVENKLLSKTDTDSLGDFKDVYDFQVVFGNVLRDSII
jgi:uncharacterized repeat protein (TIGR04138 family)